MTNAFAPSAAHNRWSEPAKFLPVAFIVFTISAIYSIYMTYHCIPLLQSPLTQRLGTIQTIVFNAITVMLIYCYLGCMLILPGSIPDGKEWDYAPRLDTVAERAGHLESKRSGERRNCKWCAKYKPDRAHHCRVCRTCILKMDHHCPWVYNCIGFYNQKSFFLLLAYSAIACHFVVWTMYGTVKAASAPEVPFFAMFFLLFGETLAVLMGSITSLFFFFHVWLMLKAITTIEFCEKSMKRSDFIQSVYDLGSYGNAKAVLGENPWLWPFPVGLPSGDGLTYVSDESPLLLVTNKDLEAGRGLKPESKKGSPKRGWKRRNEAGTGECATSSDEASDITAEPSTPMVFETNQATSLVPKGALP
jgi:hypothetical protein